jgi:NADPH:quinone reductase-like Zn-dependent oxidoreductase
MRTSRPTASPRPRSHTILAIRCIRQSATDPLSGLDISTVPEPEPSEEWITVHMRAAAINHHDIWSLRGVGLAADRLPMILGCDGAGVLDDGTEVVVHAVIGDPAEGRGDETLDPDRTLLSELHPGTLAESVLIPARNAVPKPSALTFEEAGCLSTAWLTAYRMLKTRSGLTGPSTILVQGAGGGVATAAIALGKALGHTVFCTSRDADKRRRALELGADVAVASNEKLPERVDLVVDSVGDATWAHSLRCLAPGGRIVTCGATTGADPAADLNRMFFRQLSVVGSTMGTRDELEALLRLLVETGVRPLIDEALPLREGRLLFERMERGEGYGKLVLTM